MKTLCLLIACGCLMAPKAQAAWWWPFSSSVKTQSAIVDQIQFEITKAITSLSELEKTESAAIEQLKKSENYKACADNSPESCGTIGDELRSRASQYEDNHLKIWNKLTQTEQTLMTNYAALPHVSEADRRGQDLAYFQKSYVQHLSMAKKAIGEVSVELVQEACVKNDLNCADTLLDLDSTNYKNLININDAALESLKTGTGDFMPARLSI